MVPPVLAVIASAIAIRAKVAVWCGRSLPSGQLLPMNSCWTVPFDALLRPRGLLAWTTVSKMRGIMSRVYKVGMLHDRVTKNPLQHVESRSKTDYKAIVLTPAQTFGILKAL